MFGKGKATIFIVGVLSMMIFSCSIVPYNQILSSFPEASKTQTEAPEDWFIPSYTLHDPINITANENFASLGFPGSGTPEIPYVISGFNISSIETCISIKDTDVFFEIRDCLIIGNSSNACIELVNVTNGLIRSNTITGSEYYSVYLSSASNNTVVNNTINENNHGMYIHLSHNNTLVNNSIIHNTHYGVHIRSSWHNAIVNNIISENDDGINIDDSHESIIENNTLSGSYNGILLYSSDTNLLKNNTIMRNGKGIDLHSSSYNTVQNNTIVGNDYQGISTHASPDNMIYSNIFVDNGVYLSGEGVDYWRQNITSDNLVNGKPLGYFWSLTSGSIDGSQYGQVILANCSGVTVENGIFNNASIGCLLGYSSFSNLRNITCSDNYCGVFATESSNNTLVNNTISGSSYYGVYLSSSSNNTISNSTLTNNRYGAYLIFSTDNKLITNAIYGPGTTGIFITSSSNNSVLDSVLSGKQYGVQITSSINNTVVNNTVTGNSQTGIYVSGLSDNNSIYLNIIEGNSRNGYDSGSRTQWNTTGFGNFWSDYDGIGVYQIPGSAGAIDYHPFIYPPDTNPPTIYDIEDFEYEISTTGHSITWAPSDAYPSHYVIFRNDSEIESESWDGGVVTVIVDGLGLGVTNYTIVVFDTSGNWNHDTVLVTVVPQVTTTTTTSPITTPTTPALDEDIMVLVYLGVSTALGIIILVLAFVFRKRK